MRLKRKLLPLSRFLYPVCNLTQGFVFSLSYGGNNVRFGFYDFM